MTINRGPFNSLIDDDGSGNVGTIWNKTQIKNVLLDPIDAEMPVTTFVPGFVGTSGGSATYSNRTGVWARSGNVVVVGGRLTLSSKGSLAGFVNVALPFNCNVNSQQGLFLVSYFGGLTINVTGLTGYLNPGSNNVQLAYVPGGGAANINPLDVGNIANTFDVLFGCAYVI